MGETQALSQLDGLSQKDIEIANQLETFLYGFKRTWVFEKFIKLPYPIIAFFTGNQFGKTGGVAYQYVLRIFGYHPIPKRNVLYFECPKRYDVMSSTEDHDIYYGRLREYLKTHRSKDSATYNVATFPEDGLCHECGEKLIIHKRKTRIFRFACESLPTEKDEIQGDTTQSAEIGSPQYPEFKKWLPRFLIKKDITVRNPAITVLDPNAGREFAHLKYKGADILVEFVSYSQVVQKTGGVQRMSIWCDEEPPFDFWEEQIPRTIADDADMIMTLTPASGVSWAYDDLYEKAQVYIRTKVICDFLSKEENKEVSRIEKTDSRHPIAVIQAATDDNPTLSPDIIERTYESMPDPDGTAVATRRYGIFKQATGRIFKDFSFRVHVIDFKKHEITNDVLANWTQGRTMDYHPKNNHALLWVAMSPDDEAFVYAEWSPNPGDWPIDAMCEEIAVRSGMDAFVCNLIDPLAKTPVQRKSSEVPEKNALEIINRCFYDLKKEGKCSGGYWQPYNTKGTAGRDEIIKRLANSVKVGKPFNNKVVDEKTGRTLRLPTIWFSREVKECCQSFKHWRVESWASSKQLATKDKKQTPTEKYSHYCTALEGLFKDKRFRPRLESRTKRRKEIKRFKGRG